QFQRPPDDGPCHLAGVMAAVSPFPGPELPGAEPDLGDLLAGPAAQITHDLSLHPYAEARRMCVIMLKPPPAVVGRRRRPAGRRREAGHPATGGGVPGCRRA